MNSFIWILSWVFIILGILLIIIGNISSTFDKRKEVYKGHTVGTVVGLAAGLPDESGRESGVHDYYYPIIAYYARGQFFKERYGKGGNPCPFSLNQKLSLCYDIESPDQFIVAEPTQLHYISKVCYFTGLGLCIAGGFTFLMFAMRIFN